MKVIIVGANEIGGGSERVRMFRDFLQSRNYSVDVIQFPGQSLTSEIGYYYQRLHSRFHGHEERNLKKTADMLEKRIKKGSYDAAICVDTSSSYVLTRDLGCLKLFCWESLMADELYFSKAYDDLERIHRIREMELEICGKSDYVIFPWTTTENFVRKHILNGNNFLTIKHGCYPRSKLVSYFFPASIVSIGNMAYSWANKELLSFLTNISPSTIDVYGNFKPEGKYRLNYKGYASSLDVLYNYQFGLNTITKDLFRRNHFSSRILGYLAYGLPVLSPDWMQFSHELKGCLPYNEDNFVNLVEEYSDKERWEKLSADAIEQAKELDWRLTLKPLERILQEK